MQNNLFSSIKELFHYQAIFPGFIKNVYISILDKIKELVVLSPLDER